MRWSPFINAAAATTSCHISSQGLYLQICCLPELLLVLQVIGATVVEVVIHFQGIAQRLQTGTAKQQYTVTNQVILLMTA
jgi:hypothetical protein